jgi:hypothetical protein
MAAPIYDQYHPTLEGTTPAPDTCRRAVQECIAVFGLPMRLVGGIDTHLGGGQYGVARPEKVDIETEDELFAHLFGPMDGAVRLVVYEPNRIEVFGCSAPRTWQVEEVA